MNHTALHLPNRKQLIVLSQLILAVWIAACFFRLRVMESNAARDEFISLAAIKSMARLPIHEVFTDRDSDDYSLQAHLAIQPPLTAYLKANHPDIDTARIDARQHLVEWLIKQGVPESVLGDATGKRHADTLPYLFFHTPLPRPNNPYFGEAELLNDAPVGFLLDETRYWADARPIKIVTAIDLTSVPDLDMNIGPSTEGRFAPTADLSFAPGVIEGFDSDNAVTGVPGDLSNDGPIDSAEMTITPDNGPRGVPSFDGTDFHLVSVRLLDQNELALTFREEQQMFAQNLPRENVIRVPVQTTTVPLAWIELIGEQLQSEQLVEVATNAGLQTRLDRTYGRIQIEQALDLTSRRMLETYGNVSLLGFDFAPKTFWLFVFAFFLLFLGAISLHLKRPYGEQHDEATTFGLHLFLDMLAFRATLWIVIPVTALLLAKPDSITDTTIAGTYWVSVAVVAVAGVAVTWLSTKSTVANPGSERKVETPRSAVTVANGESAEEGAG